MLLGASPHLDDIIVSVLVCILWVLVNGMVLLSVQGMVQAITPPVTVPF